MHFFLIQDLIEPLVDWFEAFLLQNVNGLLVGNVE